VAHPNPKQHYQTVADTRVNKQLHSASSKELFPWMEQQSRSWQTAVTTMTPFLIQSVIYIVDEDWSNNDFKDDEKAEQAVTHDIGILEEEFNR
jgi:CRISPR/Cas system endoribonuclease Cas6 (RAMP superfamily)